MTGKKVKVAMSGTMSNMSFLSTLGQVTERLNAQYSHISISSDSLCLTWLSASLNW